MYLFRRFLFNRLSGNIYWWFDLKHFVLNHKFPDTGKFGMLSSAHPDFNMQTINMHDPFHRPYIKPHIYSHIARNAKDRPATADILKLMEHKQVTHVMKTNYISDSGCWMGNRAFIETSKRGFACKHT